MWVIILILFLITNGNISMFGYYFVWHSLIRCMFYPELNGGKISDWIWIGNLDAYSKYLDEVKKRIDKLK